VIRIVVVFCLSLAILGVGIGSAGIASTYSDPVSQLRAQDESTYANSAVGLAGEGGWLTPKVMGRFLLYKPPLLVWLAGASLKLLGKSLFALRLPDLLAAAFAATLVFFWRSWTAWILLVSSPFWHIFARLCYTDMLLAAAFTGAMFCLHRDSKLESRAAFWGFAAFASAGILAKSVAGLLPVFVLILYWLVLDGRECNWTKIFGVCSVIALIVAPWHIYQLAVHREWFIADYIGVQILGFGLQPPSQHALEGQLLFYGQRLIWIDPVLAVLAAISLIWLIRDCRKRAPEALLLTAWIVVVVAALFAFRFRNLPYILSLVPALALITSKFTRGRWSIAVLCCLFIVKAFFPAQAWGLSFGAAPPIPEAQALRNYWEQGRPNELILIAPADEFYSFNLPGLKVRYCFPDPDGVVLKYAPHYGYLGITLTGNQFLHLDQLRPEYAQRLREWGLDSSEPIGTAIVVKSEEEALGLIGAFPATDFELPEAWASSVKQAGERDVKPASPGRVFLLARNSTSTRTVARATLPPNW
jgi:hypothetical protein